MKTIGTIRREKGYGGRLARRDEEHRQDADEERMRNTCMARISTDGKKAGTMIQARTKDHARIR
jgi:hypothetical protein